MNVSSDQIPEPARTAWLQLRDGLRDILGDDLVAIWAHGGTLASVQARQADLDTYVVLAGRPDAPTVQAIEQLQDAIEADVGLDGTAGTSQPTRRSNPGRRRMHSATIASTSPGRSSEPIGWRAATGRSTAHRRTPSFPPRPRRRSPPTCKRNWSTSSGTSLPATTPIPTRPPTPPQRQPYPLLARDPGRHDLEARGRSLVAEAPARPMAPLLQAAIRNYEGKATPEDTQVLAAGMPPFVAMVRDVMSRSA